MMSAMAMMAVDATRAWVRERAAARKEKRAPQPVLFDMQKALQDQYNELCSAGLSMELCDMIQREALGGECPRCGMGWIKVVVKEPVGFHYYQPSCSCYGRCPKCGESLHRHTAGGTWPECACGWQKPRVQKPVTPVEKYKAGFAKTNGHARERNGKEAATGERPE